MIDRALGFSSPTESFYFQLYPVNLILKQEPVPSAESKFRFSIFKGMQKFDENKIMTDANFINSNGTEIMPFRGCQLNFYLPNFNKNRKVLFTLKLNEKEGTEEFELGGVDIDPANYIQEFRQNATNRFEQKVDISDQFTLEFEMYVEKSRFALQKIVKSFKTQRTMKSPVRQRKSPNRVTSTPTQQKEQSVSKFSRSKAQTPKEQPQPEAEPEPQVQASRTKSIKKQSIVNETVHSHFQTNDNKSDKSHTIVSPMTKSKPVKRESNRNDSTVQMRASQRLPHNAGSQPKQNNVPPPSLTSKQPETWKDHLQLVAFTVVGLLIIYWVMHPTPKV